MNSYSNGVIELGTAGGTVRAVITESGWECDDPVMLEFLNQLFPFPVNSNINKSPAAPPPIRQILGLVQEATGAKIIEMPKCLLPHDTVF